MKVLGIETSCDETAVCLIEASGDLLNDFQFTVLGNALISQAKMHAEYGGVFPNLAKREHAKNLVPLMTQVFKETGAIEPSGHNSVIAQEKFEQIEKLLEREPELIAYLTLFLAQHKVPDIDAIAVTAGPGLEPALWVGINFSRALSIAWDKPVVAVNHMEGHIMMSMTTTEDGISHMSPFEFPLLALLISGGHTELVLSKEWMRYELVGQTKDDAIGEAYDKAARMIGLDYPGGPEISRMADLARGENLRADFKLPRPMLSEDNFDFSFSGLKTAVRKIVEAQGELNDDFRKKMSREFEEAAAEVLVKKTLAAVGHYGASTVVVGGGVSANTFIRKSLAEALEKDGSALLLIPPPELATDNAIMIALAGYFHAQKGNFADISLLTAKGNLRLG
jgi:N6-L-threonylcarbamoyladenine synthase